LIRCPGTTNSKLADDPRRVEIISCHPERYYSREQVEAALAPDSALQAARRTAVGSGADLGLDLADLHELWATAQRLPGRTPERIADVLAARLDPRLAALWSGAADGQYDHDDNRPDMAVARWVLEDEGTPRDAVLAIMCRRLRIGRKAEKADPARRTDYVLGTVAKVAASLATERARRTARAADARAVLDVTQADDSGDPDPARPALSVVTPALPAATPPRLRAEEPVPDPRVEHADAPRVPRLGLESSTPAGPAPGEEADLCGELSALLGLPEGIAVWAVGMRRLVDDDEIRLWCARGETGVVYGRHWPVGTVAATRWRHKPAWDAKEKLAELLFHDLHITADPVRAWRKEGRPVLYRVARQMTEGTPAEIVRLVLLELLHGAAGTSSFATARSTGDPWVRPDSGDGPPLVWLPLRSLRDGLIRAGWARIGALDLVDILDLLGCRVKDGLTVPDGHREITDPRQWVRVAPSVAPAMTWAEVALWAAQRDEEERRDGIRAIGGGRS
jgi:hypothetical protein